MPEINEIRRELSALRADMLRLSPVGIPGAVNASEWSAHANWKSGSSKLNGDFEVVSRLTNVTKTELIESAIKDSSSDKFIEVAKEISGVVSE